VLSDSDWQPKLRNLFNAYVNQQCLEDAAKYMASFAAGDEEAHSEFLFLFKRAKELVADNDSTIISAINCSGYSVETFEEAEELVIEFEEEYLKAYELTRL